ncbi:hypothetical protein N431DRAFT_521550, partial [Stipitochalara longipes BDJ]
MSKTSQSDIYSLHKIHSQESFTFSPQEFSRFKFGDDDVAHRYGAALAAGFIRDRLEAKDIPKLVVAVAYQFVPTAAYAMQRYFLTYLNRWLASIGAEACQRIQIHRVASYQTDYGKLSAEGRMQMIEGDGFHIDKEMISGKTVLALDDIRITGSHEKRILKMFDKLNILTKPSFIYFAELVNPEIDPSIENLLNFWAMKTMSDADSLVKSGNFVINTRFIKHVLSFDIEVFSLFLEGQEESFLCSLLDMAIGNGYHQIKTYQGNLNTLQRALAS